MHLGADALSRGLGIAMAIGFAFSCSTCGWFAKQVRISGGKSGYTPGGIGTRTGKKAWVQGFAGGGPSIGKGRGNQSGWAFGMVGEGKSQPGGGYGGGFGLCKGFTFGGGGPAGLAFC